MATIKIEFDELEILPQGWDWIPLEALVIEPTSDIVDGPFGSNLKASEYKDEGITIARLQNIDRNQFVYKNIRFISPNKAKELERHNFMPGDILITKLGAPLGKACISPQQILQGVIVADLVRVRIRKDHINRIYLSYAINSPFLVKQFEKHIKGTTRPCINLGVIRKLPIPVAPRNEQNRIVAEIEKQFSRLDEAMDNLRRIKANLKRYKASVLKAAVEGKLTEQWRTEHPDVEPASILLERILTERHKKWEEAELANMKAKGKEPNDDKWKKKYRTTKGVKDDNLHSLPSTWKWISLGQITGLITKGSSPNWQGFRYVKKGIPFLRSQNVLWGYLDLSNIAHLPKAFNDKQSKSIVKTGDVLLNIVGASIGRAAIANKSIEDGNLNQAVAIIRLIQSAPYNIFLLNYLISEFAQRKIYEGVVDVARGNFSLNDISNLPVPLPPEMEQAHIINEIERRLSLAKKIEFDVVSNMARAEQLRQSILKQAFKGRLIPQDPRDEPARKLLDRIRAEREIHKEELKKKMKKGKKTMTPKERAKEKRDILAVLKEAEGPMRPEDLFRTAGYKPEEVEEFYADLKIVNQQTAISQVKKKNGEVFLKAM